MALNCVMAVILCYFTEFGKPAFQHITASICGGIYARAIVFCSTCTMSSWRKFTFAISICWWVSCSNFVSTAGRRKHITLVIRVYVRLYASLFGASVYESVFFKFLISRMHGRIFMKLTEITQCQVHVTLITFSRSWVQRSRSGTDNGGQRNLVNSIAPEPVKGFEPKLTQILATVGRRTD